MTEKDREALLDAIEVLNTYGGKAAAFFAAALAQPENTEAEAWVASLWEPEYVGSH
jgi:hypothetical protein